MFNLLRIFVIGLSLAVTVSQVIHEGRCPRPRSSKAFNTSMLLGVWYLQSTYYYCPQANSKCNVMNVTVTNTTHSNIHSVQFNQVSFNQANNNSLQSSSSMILLDVANPSQVVSKTNSSCLNGTQPCNILMGDDFSYFVEYCCQAYNAKGFISEIVQVFARNKTANRESQRGIARILRRWSVDQKYLLPISQNCTTSPLGTGSATVVVPNNGTTTNNTVSSTTSAPLSSSSSPAVATPTTLPGTAST